MKKSKTQVHGGSMHLCFFLFSSRSAVFPRFLYINTSSNASGSKTVTVPRPRETMPRPANWLSIRVTTSREEPIYRAICSWVAEKEGDCLRWLSSNKKVANRFSRLRNINLLHGPQHPGILNHRLLIDQPFHIRLLFISCESVGAGRIAISEFTSAVI